MNAWMTLWTWVLIVGIAAFAVTAVVVGIGAIFDIRDLFRSISERHETHPQDNPPKDDGSS